MPKPRLSLASAPSDGRRELHLALADEGLEILNQLEEALDIINELPWQTARFASTIPPLHSFASNAGALHQTSMQALSTRLIALIEALEQAARPLRPAMLSLLQQAREALVEQCKALASQEQEGNTPPSAMASPAQLLVKLEQAADNVRSGQDIPSLPIGELMVSQGELQRADLERVLELQQQPTGALLVALGLTTPDRIQDALRRQPQGTRRPRLKVEALQLEQFQMQLERLMSLSTQLEQTSREDFPTRSRQLRQLSRQLWDKVVDLRQQKLGPIFERSALLAKELAFELGKEVSVHLEGQHLELETELIYELAHLLNHAVRNAVQHGIEPPSVRARQQKSREGNVRIVAQHRRNRIEIKIEDDGIGLDRHQILSRIQALNLTIPAGGDSSTIFEPLFNPLFRPANHDETDEGSLHGLPFIRDTLLMLGGQCALQSPPGGGTSLLLALPTRLGQLEGLVVKTHCGNFALPLSCVQEFNRPTRSQVLQTPGMGTQLSLRGWELPVFWLDQRLGRPLAREPLWEQVVVVLRTVQGLVGLVVKEVLGPQLLPFPQMEGEARDGVAGVAILETGEIAEWIDVERLLGEADPSVSL